MPVYSYISYSVNQNTFILQFVNYSQSLPVEDSFSIPLETFCKNTDPCAQSQASRIRISGDVPEIFPAKEVSGEFR